MTGIVILVLRALLAIALYAFLARALYGIWRDLRAQSSLIASRQVPPLTIANLEAGEGSKARAFTVPEVVIGRDPSCEYVLPDETVSSRHARLSYHHNQWWVEDLQSTNGTFLNDERVYTPAVIISNDEVRCGQERLLLTIENPE